MSMIENLCRLCLTETDSNRKPIYSSSIGDSNLITVIRKICYKISMKSKELPQFICAQCFTILENACNLCETSVSSERQLQVMMSGNLVKDENGFDGFEDFSSNLKQELEADDTEHSHIKNDISMQAAIVQFKMEPDLEIEIEEDEEEEEEEEIEEENDGDYDQVKTDKKPKKITKKHKCNVCNKLFEKPSKLARHQKTHDPNKRPYACNEPNCFQRFLTHESLQRHDIIHKMTIKVPEPYVKPCPICAKQFNAQEAMASHMRIHKDELENFEFKCNLCDKTFKKLNELTRHSKTHSQNKNYKCQICSKMFSQGSHLIDHLNRHKGLRPHVCHVCNKAFQQSSTLKDHLRTHSQEKPFLCSTCGKSFNNPSNLRQHVKRHQNLKEFECSLCPSRFSCKASLQSHIDSHSGIKSHTCAICGSSFTKGTSLKKHIRSIHEGIKDHQCNTCPMRFSSAEHLKRHSRTHTGEKPYKCDFPNCDKAYAQSNDLHKHKKSHLGGENIYKCTYDFCNESFRLKSQLRDHYVVHKKNTSDEQEECQ